MGFTISSVNSTLGFTSDFNKNRHIIKITIQWIYILKMMSTKMIKHTTIKLQIYCDEIQFVVYTNNNY